MSHASNIGGGNVGNAFGNKGEGGSGLGASVLRWTGRGTAVLLAIVWSLFFVEHLSEWFLNRHGAGYPPWWVWAAMVFHFAMIAGLAMTLRWDGAGMAVALLGTIGFLLITLKGSVAAWIVLVNLVPILAIALAMRLRSKRATRT